MCAAVWGCHVTAGGDEEYDSDDADCWDIGVACRGTQVGRSASAGCGLWGGRQRARAASAGASNGETCVAFFFSPTGAGCVLEMSRRCCRLSSGLWPWSYSNVPIRPYAGSGSLLVKWIGTRSELCYCLVLVINLVDVNYLIIIAL